MSLDLGDYFRLVPDTSETSLRRTNGERDETRRRGSEEQKRREDGRLEVLMTSGLPRVGDQLELGLDWSKYPWNGLSPRYLLNVEKSRTFPKPATVEEKFTDPAQLKIFLEGSLNG